MLIGIVLHKVVVAIIYIIALSLLYYYGIAHCHLNMMWQPLNNKKKTHGCSSLRFDSDVTSVQNRM